MEANNAKDKLELLHNYQSLIQFYSGDYDLTDVEVFESLLDELDAEIDFYLEQSMAREQTHPIIAIN